MNQCPVTDAFKSKIIWQKHHVSVSCIVKPKLSVTKLPLLKQCFGIKTACSNKSNASVRSIFCRTRCWIMLSSIYPAQGHMCHRVRGRVRPGQVANLIRLPFTPVNQTCFHVFGLWERAGIQCRYSKANDLNPAYDPQNSACPPSVATQLFSPPRPHRPLHLTTAPPPSSRHFALSSELDSAPSPLLPRLQCSSHMTMSEDS